jgi:hypothetical protein
MLAKMGSFAWKLRQFARFGRKAANSAIFYLDQNGAAR